MTHDLCQAEAERRVNASNEVAGTTQTLQQQTFPQVAQTGPAVPPPSQGISGP